MRPDKVKRRLKLSPFHQDWVECLMFQWPKRGEAMKKFPTIAIFYLLSTVPALALTAPAYVTARVVSSTEVNVTWSDRSKDESGFSVYRSDDGGTSFAKVATVPPNSLGYSDKGLKSGTRYTYRVEAFVAAAASSSLTSTQTPGTVLPPPDPPPTTGYPDATNTGVQAGITLKRIPEDVTSGPGWHWDSRGWVTIDGVGALFSGYSVTSSIDVVADNVIIENVKAVFADDGWAIGVRHASNVTIRNCEIGGVDTGAGRLMAGIKSIYGDEGDITIQKCNIYGTSTGIQIYRGLIEDNYIHDLGYKSGDHVNGITSNASTGPLVIRHNTVYNQISQTDAISLFEDFGVQRDVLIENNKVAGGGYTIYAGQNAGGPQTSNIVVKNNRISRRHFVSGGYFGPATAFSKAGPGNVWTGNVWDDTGIEIPAP
jgi:hypothetical protein